MAAVQSFRSIQAAAAHGEARTWGGASDWRSYEFWIKKSQINFVLIWPIRGWLGVIRFSLRATGLLQYRPNTVLMCASLGEGLPFSHLGIFPDLGTKISTNQMRLAPRIQKAASVSLLVWNEYANFVLRGNCTSGRDDEVPNFRTLQTKYAPGPLLPTTDGRSAGGADRIRVETFHTVLYTYV